MLKNNLILCCLLILTSCAMENKVSPREAAKMVRIRTVKEMEIETCDITDAKTILDLKRKLNTHEYAVGLQILVAVRKVPWTFGIIESESGELADNQSIRDVMSHYKTDLFQSYTRKR